MRIIHLVGKARLKANGQEPAFERILEEIVRRLAEAMPICGMGRVRHPGVSDGGSAEPETNGGMDAGRSLGDGVEQGVNGAQKARGCARSGSLAGDWAGEVPW